VFLLVAAGWISRELLVRIPGLERLSDMGIAVKGALLLFLLPSGAGAGAPFAACWTGRRGAHPLGIVLLFGGGLPVAGAMETTGLSDWLAGALGGLRGLDLLLIWPCCCW
jgi:sodium-dependent dicarboxylate transporter 2/3/5